MEEQLERDPSCTHTQGNHIYRVNLSKCEKEITEEEHDQERAESIFLGQEEKKRHFQSSASFLIYSSSFETQNTKLLLSDYFLNSPKDGTEMVPFQMPRKSTYSMDVFFRASTSLGWQGEKDRWRNRDAVTTTTKAERA